MDAEFDGAAADAVDAEREIKNRPDSGMSQTTPIQMCGGAGVAFIEQGVGGGEQAGEQIKPRGEVRPEREI